MKTVERKRNGWLRQGRGKGTDSKDRGEEKEQTVKTGERKRNSW